MENYNLVKQSLPDAEKTAWLKWLEYHRLIFGWRSDADTEMMLSWIGLFRRSGLTPEALTAATESIAKQETPPYGHAAHLNALEIWAKIFIKKNTKPPSPITKSNSTTCTKCQYPGLIDVPDLKQITLNHWTGTDTCYVYCDCAQGINYATIRNKNTRFLGISEYSTINPNWQTQLQTRKDIQTDKTKNNLDTIINKIVKKMGLYKSERIV